MISGTLPGGLGNMLFVIAASSALAWRNNDESHYFLNDHYGLCHRHPTLYKDTIFRKLNIAESSTSGTRYEYTALKYKKIPYSNSMKVHGYFQSEKYFKDYSKEIKNLFCMPEVTLNYLKSKYKNILDSNTLSIHVRRGDYLNYPHIHPVCDVSYYQKGLENIKDIQNILVFSDDISWCKNNLNFPYPTHYIEETDVTELWLMSLCKHNIIANSTFSWWGHG